jgi:hypothetical protein
MNAENMAVQMHIAQRRSELKVAYQRAHEALIAAAMAYHFARDDRHEGQLEFLNQLGEAALKFATTKTAYALACLPREEAP